MATIVQGTPSPGDGWWVLEQQLVAVVVGASPVDVLEWIG